MEPHADFDTFESTLCEIMHIINKEDKQCIIIWDINIDLLKFETHPKTETYLDSIFSNGYLPVIVKPTRITAPSVTLTNNITSRRHSGIIITDVSDHFGIFHIISTKAAQHKTNVFKNRLSLKVYAHLQCHSMYYNRDPPADPQYPWGSNIREETLAETYCFCKDTLMLIRKLSDSMEDTDTLLIKLSSSQDEMTSSKM